MGCMCASERVPGKAEKNDKSRAAKQTKQLEEQKAIVRRKTKRQSTGGITQRDIEVFRRIYEPFDTYYSLQSPLCEGETRKVEVRVYAHTNIPCCVLTVSKKANKKADASLKNLRAEIELRTRLDHPHILSVYEVLHNEENYYLVTEQFVGDRLGSYIGDVHISERHAGQIVRRLLLALNYCHKLGITYGKLGLNSVVLTAPIDFDKIETKLTGFGRLDRVPESSTSSGLLDCHFVAPEAIKGTATSASDVWSCGVMLYTLLAGQSPFPKAADLKAVAKGQMRGVTFSATKWAQFSPEATLLVESMLKREPGERPTVQQCLEHPWFSYACRSLEKSTDNALGHLHKFLQCKTCNVLQETLMKFIVTRIYPRTDLSAYQLTFEAVDLEFDGVITESELKQWVHISLPDDQVQPTVARLMGLMDADGSGQISYTEFLMACIGRSAVLTDEYVKEAFRCLDRDKSGKVTIKEIKTFFCKKHSPKAEKEWRETIKKADSSGDGEISFPELKALLS